MATGFPEKNVVYHRSACPKILEYADENREEGFFVDVTIVVDKLNIPANRLVLSCCSKVFETMFKTQMKERYEQTVNITAVDGESVKTLIDFMYSGSITINSENVLQLLAAADYLQMEEIETFCAEFLESILTPANCNTILGAVNLYRLERLRNLIYQMISDKFDEFAQTDDFRSFSKANVKSCISNLNKDQAKETSVYQAIVAWTKFDATKRIKDFPDLFQMVQLDKLPRQFLKIVVSTEDLVWENLSCAKLVMATLFKHLENKIEAGDSKIISIGGSLTPGQVIEVHNCENKQATKYQNFPENVAFGWAMKHFNHFYYVDASVKIDQSNNVFQLSIHGNTVTANKVTSVDATRCLFAAAFFYDALVVSGGYDRVKQSSSTACYLPSVNEWKLIASTNIAKSNNVLVSGEGCLYDIGGWERNNALSSVERLRGLEEKWEVVQPMQTRRHAHAAVAHNGQIYVIGGSCDGCIKNTLKSAERYDPSSNKWIYIKDMNFCRHGHAVCVLRDKIYVVGGKDSQDQFVREIECYDPDSDTWNIVGVTPVDLFGHTLIAV